MAMSRLVPWGLFASVLVGAGALWHGTKPTTPVPHPEPTAAERAEAAGIHPTRLIVDFRDDISSQVLTSTPYDEQPISDYSAIDRLYRIDFKSADEAAAAARALSRDPRVETVDYDSEATIPPDEAIAAGTASLESECA